MVDQALEGIRRSGAIRGRSVVVDNGSTDRSAEVGDGAWRDRRLGNLAGATAVRTSPASTPRGASSSSWATRDDTYPLDELGPFVERLRKPATTSSSGLASRERSTGTRCRFSNRYVGNPILTGMLNVLFGVNVSDAHCGMRAIQREALQALDLHSTGMEFASEMVFKAYRRGMTVSEVPIDYYPSVGESKLNRFGDAWRHVRFMLLYSPSWLYLGPGELPPPPRDRRHGRVGDRPWWTSWDKRGRSTQCSGFVALTLIGAQVIQLGVFARTYARVRIGERDALLERTREASVP